MPQIIQLSSIVDPETGLTIKQENLAKTHGIPLFTMVEIVRDPAHPDPDDGLRLFVQAHIRDCDGTPLYALTARYTLVGRSLDHNDDSEDERFYARLYAGGTIHGYREESLTIFRTAEDVLSEMLVRGYGVVDGKVKFVG
jgi:hypothetical protein